MIVSHNISTQTKFDTVPSSGFFIRISEEQGKLNVH